MIDRFRDSTYIAIVFITTFALAYLLGTSVLYLIDHKMNDISINMPRINIPANILSNGDYLDGGENTVNKQSTQSRGNNIILGKNKGDSDVSQSGGYPKSIKVLKNKKMNVIENFDGEVTPNDTCSVNKDCNLIPGQTENVCKYDNTCHCLTGTGPQCNRSLTYYKELSEMTVEQREKFKKRAKLSKMTLRDYTNWLSMFKNDLDGLVMNYPEHSLNFEKYLRGEEITPKDLIKVKESIIMNTLPNEM